MSGEQARAPKEVLLSDEQIRRKHLDDPEVMRRAQEVLDEIARGEEPKSSGITAEELPDLLREHG